MTSSVERTDLDFKISVALVYTQENAGDIPLKGPSPYPDIEDISINPKGVKTLIHHLNLNKAPAPDDLSARVLKEHSAEIAQVPACIFNQSLIQTTVPDDLASSLYLRKERSTTRQITGQFLWPVYVVKL